MQPVRKFKVIYRINLPEPPPSELRKTRKSMSNQTKQKDELFKQIILEKQRKLSQAMSQNGFIPISINHKEVTDMEVEAMLKSNKKGQKECINVEIEEKQLEEQEEIVGNVSAICVPYQCYLSIRHDVLEHLKKQAWRIVLKDKKKDMVHQ